MKLLALLGATVLAAGTVVAATPATAQYRGHGGYHGGYHHRYHGGGYRYHHRFYGGGYRYRSHHGYHGRRYR